MDDIQVQESTVNTIILELEGKEVIKINKEGFFYEGRLVKEDIEIYELFKKFLNKSAYLSPFQLNHNE